MELHLRSIIAAVLLSIGIAGLVEAASFTRVGDLSTSRGGPGTALLSNGQAIVCGGYRAFFFSGSNRPHPGEYQAVGGAELFDPSTNSFRSIPGIPPGSPRPITLPTGKVLFLGSEQQPDGSSKPAAWLFEPIAGTFTAISPPSQERYGGVLLDDGRLLFVGRGGLWSNTSEFFDPQSERWLPGPATTLNHMSPIATRLADGRVLVTGQGTGAAERAEIFDPVTNSFTPTGTMLQQRDRYTATLLQDGSVLIAGGTSGARFVPGTTGSGAGCTEPIPATRAELYDPATGTFTWSGYMTTARVAFSATLLDSGEVLFAGGEFDRCDGVRVGSSAIVRTSLSTTEIFNPAGTRVDGSGLLVRGTFVAGPEMTAPRGVHGLVRLKTGQLLLAGGLPPGTTSTAEIYNTTAPLFNSVPPAGPIGSGVPVRITNKGPSGNGLTIAVVSLTTGWTTTGLPIYNLAPSSSATFTMQCTDANAQAGTLVVATNEEPPRQLAFSAPCSAIGAATSLRIVADPSAQKGAALPFTVTAFDQVGNVVPGFAGTVHFTSTDPAALLPGDVALTQGTGTFSVTFNTIGTHTITATDRSNPAITGSATLNVLPVTAVPALSWPALLALAAALSLVAIRVARE